MIAFSPDGRTTLLGIDNYTAAWDAANNSVSCRDMAGGRETRKLTGHCSCVSSIVFSLDGRKAHREPGRNRAPEGHRSRAELAAMVLFRGLVANHHARGDFLMRRHQRPQHLSIVRGPECLCCRSGQQCTLSLWPRAREVRRREVRRQGESCAPRSLILAKDDGHFSLRSKVIGAEL